MTKYVISGYIGFDNFGDELIAEIIAQNLKKSGENELTWLSSNPDKTARTLDVKAFHMLKFLQPIQNADVLISGGGSLLQDITSLKSLVYYLLVISTALFFNKKVIIFAQGFSKFRTKIGAFMTKFVLKRCYKISVRDKQSYEMLKSIGISSQLVHDPAWCVETPVSEHHGIGIQLRSSYNLTDEFLENLAKLVAEKYSPKEIRLLSLQNNNDICVLEKFGKILARYNLKYTLIHNTSIKDTIKELSSLETLISMRFHACLIASKANVKVLGINYDKKVEQLSKEIGFPLLELNSNNIQNVFETFDSFTPQYNIPEFNFNDIPLS